MLTFCYLVSIYKYGCPNLFGLVFNLHDEGESMNRYLSLMTFIGALLISPIGSNALAESQLPSSPEEIPVEEDFLLDTLEPFILNADSVHDIAEFPIVFEGTLYQPNEYISYFKNGLEIELYLIHELDEQGNALLYAYRTVQEAVSHILNASDTEVEEPRYQTRKAKGCQVPYSWYRFWTGWNPHYAYSFQTVPSNYQGYFVDVPYCAKRKWKKLGRIYIPGCADRKTKDVKVNAKDHVPGKEKDIMFEKRSILRYCYGSGTYCMRYARVCRK
jgi:hypothetical protein